MPAHPHFHLAFCWFVHLISRVFIYFSSGIVGVQMLMMAKWMNDYERGFGSAGRCIALAELRKLKASGASLRPHPSFQSSLAKVMNLLAISENLEQRAAACTAPGYSLCFFSNA